MSKLGIYKGFGIELEYMIANSESLKVNPVCDEVLKVVTGGYNSDFDNEDISWSNELVLHVIELKTNGPTSELPGLENKFHENVLIINDILGKWNCALLPTGAHPFFNPAEETRLWPHENNPVYDAYNRIFGCKGHGWSNLQSTHINLPFSNDEEFKRLHAAIRFIMPIIPGLTASTPVLDSNASGFIDTRLNYYRNNQKRVPSLTGDVIPEILMSEAEYNDKVFKLIYRDIEPFDTDDILKHEWLNSRGAIARFDRGSIEIRIIDLQESPLADVSLSSFIIETIASLSEDSDKLARVINFPQDNLVNIFSQAILAGENTLVTDKDYLSVFGINENTTINAIWKTILYGFTNNKKFMSDNHYNTVENILKSGTLSTRILKALNGDYSHENILTVYKLIRKSLTDNTLFLTT